jgi:oxygen-independent coproporphyrinogen-3 oxidase
LKSPRRYVEIVDSEYETASPDPVSSMSAPAGPVDQVDVTTPAIDVAETMMMGMRLNEGVTHARFEARFGVKLETVFPDEVARLLKLGLIEVNEHAVLLSERGRLLGNEVFAEFIGEG